jgi:hypothetical protein
MAKAEILPKGYRELLDEIVHRIARSQVRAPASTVPFKPRKRRMISAAGRKRIAEAQRRRWAAQKTAAKKRAA